MKLSVELEEWLRLTQLAKLIAEQGEYAESIEWLSKAPLGAPKDGKITLGPKD